MDKKLFPEEIINDSSEANFSRHSVQTKLIYIMAIAALACVFIALPFIHVTVSVKSQGIIQPETNRNQLVSLVSGNIEELHIEENVAVVRGQVMAKISAPVLREQGNYNSQQQQRIRRYLSDLSLLLDMDASWLLASFDVDEKSPETAREVTTAESREPSPLIQYKDEILRVIRNSKQAGSLAGSRTGTENSFALQNQHALTELWKLLHLDSSFLLNRLGIDQQDQAAYKRVLTQFKDRNREYLEKISEAREEAGVSQPYTSGPNGRNNTVFGRQQGDLQTAWDDLIENLETNSLQVLETPASEAEKVPVRTNNSAVTLDNEIILSTPKYRSSLLEFKQQVRGNILEIKRATQKYNRDRQLFDREIISEETYENSGFQLESARIDYQLLFDQQQSRWQAEQVAYQDELEQLSSEMQQIGEEQDRYIIRAPISGTIQNMTGISEGSQVSANQTLAEISPDTTLVVECYIPPKDIGLIMEGMEARFQVSAYDYNQWGLLTGTVLEISDDVTMINNQPYFRVRASLDQTWLELQNGYRGNLKKGMSLVARFNVTERSLYQLLYDKMDDWLNPAWNNPGETPVQQASM